MRLRIILPNITKLKKDFDSNLPFGLKSKHLGIIFVGILGIILVYFVISAVFSFTNSVVSVTSNVVNSTYSPDSNTQSSAVMAVQSTFLPLLGLIPLFLVAGILISILRLIGGQD